MVKRADALPADGRSRRQLELIRVASQLFAQRGFHAVAISDISGQLGLSGPAFYRHFPSKEALLVAVLDDSITSHLEGVRELDVFASDAREAVEAIVAHHIEFVFDQTGNIRTWRIDFGSLPVADRSRLRYLQRLYTDEWIRAVRRLHPALDAEHARALCQAAIAAVQSPSESSSELSREAHTSLLLEVALRALGALPGSEPWATPGSRPVSLRAEPS